MFKTLWTQFAIFRFLSTSLTSLELVVNFVTNSLKNNLNWPHSDLALLERKLNRIKQCIREHCIVWGSEHSFSCMHENVSQSFSFMHWKNATTFLLLRGRIYTALLHIYSFMPPLSCLPSPAFLYPTFPFLSYLSCLPFLAFPFQPSTFSFPLSFSLPSISRLPFPSSPFPHLLSCLPIAIFLFLFICEAVCCYVI